MEQSRFVQCLTSCQPKLYAYIRSLVGDPDHANDVLQETNLIIWQKAEQFTEGTNFGAWACRIALYQVMAWRRDAGRSRLFYNELILERVADAAEKRSAKLDQLNTALRRCIEKLTDAQRTLLKRRYFDQIAVKKIADEDKRTANAVSRSLFRIRCTLLNCVEGILAREESV